MKLIDLLSVGGLVLGGCSAAGGLDVKSDLDYCDSHVQEALVSLKGDGDSIDYTMIPRNIAPGGKHWTCRAACAEEWCSGFWPGVLWYDYQYTGDSTLISEADRYTRALAPIVAEPVFDHDLGFLIFCSYGNGYRLTANPEYKQVILNAADSLATLYNPNVGTLLAWPRNVEMFGGHNTIMDTMINLEMLFWASKNGGGSELYDIAVNHALTTMKHHFRPDYTSYHVAVYDPETGEFLRGCTHQGYDDNSMWARGQAWAIYGYTVVYRETHDRQFLDFAQNVADVYLDRLPDDRIPYWDFNDPRIPDAPRDASAACAVASALIELSGYVDGEKSEHYLAEAKSMLESLASDKYRSNDCNDAFLLHSTGHHPAGSEIDYSIVYADYYYIEALNRLLNLSENANFAKLN